MRNLHEAQAAHRAGRIEAAEKGYRALLELSPNDPDALHFLGLLMFQTNRQLEGIEFTKRSLQSAPDNPHAWNNLGNMLVVREESQAAIEAYQRAATLAPDLVLAWYNLGICHRRVKQVPESVAAFCKAVDLQPTDSIIYERFGMILYGIGQFQQAAGVYRQWLAKDPDSVVARHMLAAMTGQDVPRRAGDAYLKKLFDGFSDSFDEQLAKLGYRAPELLASTLGEYVSNEGNLHVLDAGCGTGLCGALLRSMATRLVGVDLSEGMVEKALQRGVYDELHLGELCAFMQSRQGSFDVVISADTLVYFGALEEVCTAARRCLRGRGVFAFTVERLESAEDPIDFAIQPHGRYAHSAAYVRAALESAGFRAVDCRDVVLRVERMVEVKGYLFVAVF